MNGKYDKKFGLKYAVCVTCEFRYETEVGNHDTLDEVIELAESLHKDNKPKCKKRELIIEYTEFLLYETTEEKR